MSVIRVEMSYEVGGRKVSWAAEAPFPMDARHPHVEAATTVQTLITALRKQRDEDQ